MMLGRTKSGFRIVAGENRGLLFKEEKKGFRLML